MGAIFIERRWRFRKYEAVSLAEMTDGFQAERAIGEWIAFDNTEPPHAPFDPRTPDEVYAANRLVGSMDKAGALTTCPQDQQQQEEDAHLAA